MVSQPISSFAAKQTGGWGTLLVEGVLLVLIGLAALAFPIMAGIGISVLLGWALIAGGVVGLVGAFASKPHLHFWWSLVSSLLTIGAGLIIAFEPLAGVFAIVVVVAAWLAMDGISSAIIASDMRRRARRGWGWLVASAAFDWLAALVLIFLGPVSGLVLVGFIVGIDLVLGGVALLALSRTVHKAAVAPI